MLKNTNTKIKQLTQRCIKFERHSVNNVESFHYTIKNIIKDKTKYNCWIPETSHISSLFVSTPEITRPFTLPISSIFSHISIHLIRSLKTFLHPMMTFPPNNLKYLLIHLLIKNLGNSLGLSKTDNDILHFKVLKS